MKDLLSTVWLGSALLLGHSEAQGVKNWVCKDTLPDNGCAKVRFRCVLGDEYKKSFSLMQNFATIFTMQITSAQKRVANVKVTPCDQ